MENKCGYCYKNLITEDYLTCMICKNNIHIKCLKRPGTPGDLAGDIFFDLKCIKCAPEKKELFTRKKLPWLLIIVLTLYNLSIQSKGLSHCGYFHWTTHIANFITKNWVHLFPPNHKPKKKWIGTIAGTLSHNNPEFFVSGFDRINEAGWWKLTYNQNPKFYLSLYEGMNSKSFKIEKLSKHFKEIEDINVVDIVSDNEDLRKLQPEEEIFSRALPYMGRPPRICIAEIPKLPSQNLEKTNKNQSKIDDSESIHSNLTDFLANELSNSTFLEELSNLNPDLNSVNSINSETNLFLDDDGDNLSWNISDLNLEINQQGNLLKMDSFDFATHFNMKAQKSQELNNLEEFDSTTCNPRIIQVTNFQEDEDNKFQSCNEVDKFIKSESISEFSEEEKDNEPFVYEKSLFTTSIKREYPWNVNNEEIQEQESGIEMMNVYDEQILHKKLKTIIDAEFKNNSITVPTWIRRIHRKLSLRALKRSMSKPIFDLENAIFEKKPKPIDNNVLDRYYHLISTDGNNKKEDSSLHARLAGSIQYNLFVSPYTSRVLHPFIYKNTKMIPPWVKLMCELQFHVNDSIPERSSLDFCYVQPQHIAAVNGLLQRIFWPGIDMSECLSYPDFSIIALYKKLIVGCAFLVPDVGHSEAYVSFMVVRPGWQRCGIASFMLYHLSQTCMSKDITLHVSATNPAVCLYQKFGFKIEEIVLDFYEKYLPVDSRESRHAFLLRMKR